MIAPKSAIDAAAMISWPNVEEISPASLSTGTSTPSEVAHRMIATSSGVSTSPPRLQPERDGERDRERQREPEQREPQHRPAQPREVDLQAGEEEHERQPDERDRPRPPGRPRPARARDGPTTMPATISSTTDGSRTPGNRPSRNGAANATTQTMSRLVSEGMGPRSPAPCGRVTASATL